MSAEEVANGLQLGQSVPDFELYTYDPNEMFFGKIFLEQIKKDGKWTILLVGMLNRMC